MEIIDIIIIFIVAVLAGTGVGGGGLLVIYLTAISGIEQIEAQSINLIFFIAASAAALPFHIKFGNINIRIVLFSTIFGIAGTFVGGVFRNLLSPESVRFIFGVMMILTGMTVFFNGKKKTKKNVS